MDICDRFVVDRARDDDWDWIAQRHAETGWDSLPEPLRVAVTREMVATQVNRQIAELRLEHGRSNQAFVARDLLGTRAGFVWVDQMRSGFTGEMQAYLLDVFVVEAWRGQGLGQLLMARAESWAKQEGFSRLGLNVAALNVAAIGLYKKLGFEVATLRMWKDLGATDRRT